MFSLTKKTDYALIALCYLAERPHVVVSAREIAERFGMPPALVMNVMKSMHHGKLLVSTRGTKGGYRLIADLGKVSVHDLILVLEGPIRLAECIILDGECKGKASCKISRGCPIQAPIRTLHGRLVSFLRDVRLSEIVRTIARASAHAQQGAVAATN
ncbi:MAG: Rrf2 family transcriptional regulator [Tepidisphaeraceae bacterium]|jgi:Rrf2 family protein